MGVNTDGILAYGYDLGCTEEWKIEGLGEYGALVTTWWDESSEDEDDLPDFVDAATARLLAAHWFTETWESAVKAGTEDGFFDRCQCAQDALGVAIVTHCSGEYPMYLLASRTVEAARGWPRDVTDAVMADMTADRERLAAALETLGITPTQAEPCWLLASYWG